MDRLEIVARAVDVEPGLPDLVAEQAVLEPEPARQAVAVVG